MLAIIFKVLFFISNWEIAKGFIFFNTFKYPQHLLEQLVEETLEAGLQDSIRVNLLNDKFTYFIYEKGAQGPT
jgi:hypothetical protein